MTRLHSTTAEAAQCLLRGGALIFPTETFYALGCLATDAAAVVRIYQIKNRESTQPLPLLAADREQAARAARLEAAPKELLERFWPGPLTVLLPAMPALPAPLVNDRGQTAIRISAHEQACELARLAGGPLTASSANLHGRLPVNRLQNLDVELIQSLNRQNVDTGLFEGDIPPAGTLPSTLVEPMGSNDKRDLRLLRIGAVSADDLEAAGFHLVLC
jgi:L-threonylcarbamoyladenylate synthase